MAPLIEVGGLGFSYGDRPVLRELTFSIEPGERMAVIGPNGAGKSTLLRALDGLLPGVGGRVRLCGRELARCSRKELARTIALVPQAAGGPMPFTVREFVALARYPHLSPFSSLRRTDLEAIDRALELTSLGELRNRTAGTLSGGERQRLLIAGAVAQGATVLLLDEPTTYLDPRHQREVVGVLRQLHREGATLVTVTHDVNHAALEHDRVLALREGAALYLGPAQGIMDNAVLGPLFGREFTFVDHPGGRGRVVIPD